MTNIGPIYRSTSSLNTGKNKKEMQFINFSHDTVSIVQVTIPVSTVQHAARLYTYTVDLQLFCYPHSSK